MPFCIRLMHEILSSKHIRSKRREGKKVSLRILCRGSCTLEAAVIVPFAAYFLAALLFFFRVLQVQTQVQEALFYASRRTASEASVISSSAALFASAEGFFRKEMAAYTLPDDWIEGGRQAVTLLRSDCAGTEITLRADYFIKLPVAVFSVRGLSISQCSSSHKWIGDCEDGQQEDYVYVTKHGTVYHRSRSCHYLDLSIKNVSATSVNALRNKDAHKYYACAECEGGSGGIVYITDYGTSYHTSLSCSGLKRTIYLIPLSEADGKAPCSKCGG